MSDTPHRTAISGDWFANAFDELYPVVYAHRTVEAAAPESAFAAAQVRLSGADAVLDLCCGNGRHMVHLLQHTSHVCGLDYSPAMLRLARGTVGTRARLVRGDMRGLPFAQAFDAVLNFFTSFGYFQTEAENASVARGIARSLKPGGRFFLDYLNPKHVEAALVPRSERAQGGYRIVEERWIDHTARRVNKTTVVSKDGEVAARSEESVRLYTLEELEALLRGAGLETDAVFGDYDGTPPAETRPRLIVIGHNAA